MAWSKFDFQTSAVTPKLSPGEYIFEVRASDDERMTDPSPASVRFRVEPPIWKRAGFLVPVAMLSLVTLGTFWILMRIRKRRRSAEKDRLEMAFFAELNPAPVLRVDSRGIILSCNDAATKLTQRAIHRKTDNALCQQTGEPVCQRTSGAVCQGTREAARQGVLLEAAFPFLCGPELARCHATGETFSRDYVVGESCFQFDFFCYIRIG